MIMKLRMDSGGGGGFFLTRFFLDHSFSACAFFLFFSSGDKHAHTYSTLYARISPQWLSELRQLWPKISGLDFTGTVPAVTGTK